MLAESSLWQCQIKNAFQFANNIRNESEKDSDSEKFAISIRVSQRTAKQDQDKPAYHFVSLGDASSKNGRRLRGVPASRYSYNASIKPAFFSAYSISLRTLLHAGSAFYAIIA